MKGDDRDDNLHASQRRPLGNLKVLVVDDQQLLREAVAYECEMLGCTTIQAENGEQGFKKFKETKVDIIISDIRMPVWDGTRFLDELRKNFPEKPPFIFMTGYSDLQPAQAFDRGADAFLSKPLQGETLRAVLSKLMLPLELRWRHPVSSSSAQPLTFEFGDWNGNERAKLFQLGRGGFFLAEEAIPLPLMPEGSLLPFQFTFANGPIKSLDGVGRLRWSRADDIPGFPSGVGVELEYLKKGCYDPLLKYLRSQKVFPFVPEGRSPRKTKKAL